VRFAASRQVSDTRVHALEGVSLTTTAPEGTSGMGPPAPVGAGVLSAASREASDTRVHAPEGVSLTTTAPIDTSGVGPSAPVGAGVLSAASREVSDTRVHAPEGVSLTTTVPRGPGGMRQEAPVGAIQSPATAKNSFSTDLRSRSLAGNSVAGKTGTAVTSPSVDKFSFSSGPRVGRDAWNSFSSNVGAIEMTDNTRMDRGREARGREDLRTGSRAGPAYDFDEAIRQVTLSEQADQRCLKDVDNSLIPITSMDQNARNRADARERELRRDLESSCQRVEALERRLERMTIDAIAHEASERSLSLEVQQLRQRLATIQRVSLPNAEVDTTSFRAPEAPIETSTSSHTDVVSNGSPKRKRTSDNDEMDASLTAQSAKRQRTDSAAVLDPSPTTQSPRSVQSDMP
jgi:hypothetical protein